MNKKLFAILVLSVFMIGFVSADIWVTDANIISGLSDVGFRSTPCGFQLNTDNYLISGNNDGLFDGWKWSGSAWVIDANIISGLSDVGDNSIITFFELSGDSYIISGNSVGDFDGWKWSGSAWVTDANIISGLSDIGSNSAPAFFKLGSDSYLISGELDGNFFGWKWSGSAWVTDANIISGLSDIGGYSTPTIKDSYLISGDFNGDFNGWRWSGSAWVTDANIISGLSDVSIPGTYSSLTFFELSGDNYLVSGEFDGTFNGWIGTFNKLLINLLSPENNTKQIIDFINFTSQINLTGEINHSNQTIYIWNENSSLFITNTSFLIGNETIYPNWTLDDFVLGNDYLWNIEACSNDGLCYWSESNYTFTRSAFLEYDVSFNSSVLETNNKRFELIINSTGVSEVSSIFWYDGNGYSAITTDLGNGNYKSARNIDIPLQNSIGNKSFNWQFDFILIDDSSIQQNSSIYSQEVNRTFFQLCNATYNIPFINFTTRNAENPFPLQDASFKSSWTWYVDGGTGSVFRNMSYEDVNENISNFKFCASPNTTLITDVDIEIDHAEFAQNYYYLIGSSLSNDTENINLYLLNDSLATPTTLLVKDKFQNPIEGMLIHVQLYDVGTDTFYTVGMAKTNNNGEDNFYFNWYDSLYKFILIQDGTTILTTNISKIFETPKIFEIPDVTTYSFDKFDNFEFGLTFNDITKVFSLTYVKPSGEVEEGCLRVIKRTSLEDTQVCLSCSSSTSSTLFCDISTYGNGTFIAAFYGTGSWFMLDWISEVIGESFSKGINDLLDKDDAAFYTILLIGIVLSLFMFNPTLGIIGTILGLLAAGALGFTVLTYSLYLGIVIIGGVIIWLLKK